MNNLLGKPIYVKKNILGLSSLDLCLMTLSAEYVFGKLTNQIHQFKFVPIRLYLTASFIYCEGFRSGMNVVLKIDL
jgi:hypothetical protein